ncbi:PPE family protein [Mycolicibacter minnesotensis]|uniref:PPE family protein n=1 Tax=Mycolicibacter minnesotensis TaxID=1118379 RepID=A0A7I7R944_9MYCO|nr:PPE family protein [Mycolicibacter minnesotensis]ORB00731.1 PPE family protein [Mycolicibacter minnesotensis]BBY34576.1 PPE family protein [Mycolicibacter minnesotensis]
MDYAALPPEINSARMYSGAGATPMTAAATTWNALGAELATTAASYESVISTLIGQEWRGPAATAMASAAAPYIAWLNSTAAAAEHAAAQASASAAAYEAAFAMTVPPAVVAANRAEFQTLVATNFLGFNTAAIATVEAHYAEMWAQDALAMYGYAAASSMAGALQPLSSPAPSTNPVGVAAQGAAVAQASASGAQNGLSELVSGIPSAMQTLASPALASPAQGGIADFFSNLINSTQNIGIWNGVQTYSAALSNVGTWHMFAGIASAIAIAHGPAAEAAEVAPMLVDSAEPASAVAGSAPMLASAGTAAPVGGLSVPSSWPAAVPNTATSIPDSAATLVSHGWTEAEDSGTVNAVGAGVPAAAAAGRSGSSLSNPRYGVKPTVMVRPVVAG